MVAESSGAVNTFVTPEGDQIQSAIAESTGFISRNTQHAVYTKFENSLTFNSYNCKTNLHVTDISIHQEGSQCNTIFVDKTLDKISSFDGNYGINFNSYTKGRQFILITDETGNTLPVNGDLYTNDKQVIFCGYNKLGGNFEFNDVRFNIEWIGIEQMLNEVKITGCITKDINTTSTNSSKVLSSENCIFNSNGFGNKTEAIDVYSYLFNNSGLSQSKYWTLNNILEYVVENYTKITPSDSSFLALDTIGVGFNLLPYINNYFNFEYNFGDTTAINNIIPMDFSLEGLGVWDAIVKIVEESKRYMIYKGYNSFGKVTVKIKPKSYLLRDSSDPAMSIAIGQIGSNPDDNILINGANVNLNRETKNIGRVILLGDYLRLNTICSSMAYSSFSGNFSSQRDTYSSISFINQTNKFFMGAIDSEQFGENQNFCVTPINQLSLTSDDVTADLNQYNLENTGIKLFEGIKALEFDRVIENGTNEEQTKKTKDVEIYIAEPSLNGPSDTSTPTQLDGANIYYYIEKAEKLSSYFSVKHKSGDHSQIIVDGSSFDAGTFSEYLTNSSLVAQYPFFERYLTPILMRANIKTDYRIKGIASIAGFDQVVHSTEIIYDNDFKLSISYKDASYNDAGNFVAIADGYINASDNNILQRIQDKAQAILDKYRVVQNSGYIELNGVQRGIKIGDWIDKFSGTGRDINARMIVSSITFKMQEKLTILQLGQ